MNKNAAPRRTPRPSLNSYPHISNRCSQPDDAEYRTRQVFQVLIGCKNRVGKRAFLAIRSSSACFNNSQRLFFICFIFNILNQFIIIRIRPSRTVHGRTCDEAFKCIYRIRIVMQERRTGHLVFKFFLL